MTKVMTFAERMAALKKTPALPVETVEEKTTEVVQTKRVFGQPKPAPAGQPNRWATQRGETPPAIDLVQSGTPDKTARNTREEPSKVLAESLPENSTLPVDIGNIILLSNEANKILPADKTEGEFLISGDMPEDAILVKQKIAELSDFAGVSLRNEMTELKKLIKASPDACMFLLPEELGLMVRALRSMTDNRVAMDMGASQRTTKAKKQKEIPLSAAELAAALDDL